MQRIPLIDLDDSAGVAREIEKACRDIGFMYVAQHGAVFPLFKSTKRNVYYRTLPKMQLLFPRR
jgi:isopenicillin N synthase-like dioxygenase